jgi:hypothetical protein
MQTAKQLLGSWGETQVARRCSCPRCKRRTTLKRLPPNFKCADLICDFCGYLAQVKTLTSNSSLAVPNVIVGAAWGPQYERLKMGIYFPLFIVLRAGRASAGYYLSSDAQDSSIFHKRIRLGPAAKRAGWQGFVYRLSEAHHRALRKVF